MRADLAPPTNLQQLADWLKVLAEPKRLLILHLLMEGVQCNCELGERLEMAPNLISHHLSVLRQAGLVDVERDALDARWIYYSINRAGAGRTERRFWRVPRPGAHPAPAADVRSAGRVRPAGDDRLSAQQLTRFLPIYFNGD